MQQSLQEEMRLHPREGWVRDVSPLIVGEDLLLKGRLLYSFLIDKRIYDVQDMYDKIPPVDRNDIGEKFIKYGIDTQGAFKLILFTTMLRLSICFMKWTMNTLMMRVF